jgi:hypothetical protein
MDGFIDIDQLALSKLGIGQSVPRSDVQHVHEGSPSAFPNGCHIAETVMNAVVDALSESVMNATKASTIGLLASARRPPRWL